jgi:serine/threonine-protein kinase
MFLYAGARLDKYEIVAPLAVGGMAELYVARSIGIEGFEKPCVLKRILPQYARDPDFVRMFLDEARLAATLHHPNVIQVYDIGVAGGLYYFAMEYVHGQDVSAIVATARAQKRGLTLGCTTRTSIADPTARRSASCIATCRRPTSWSATTAT